MFQRPHEILTEFDKDFFFSFYDEALKWDLQLLYKPHSFLPQI